MAGVPYEVVQGFDIDELLEANAALDIAERRRNKEQNAMLKALFPGRR